jgi:hypothetical protein
VLASVSAAVQRAVQPNPHPPAKYLVALPADCALWKCYLSSSSVSTIRRQIVACCSSVGPSQSRCLSPMCGSSCAGQTLTARQFAWGCQGVAVLTPAVCVIDCVGLFFPDRMCVLMLFLLTAMRCIASLAVSALG